MTDVLIPDREFAGLVGDRSHELFLVARYIQEYAGGGGCFTRPLLGDLLSEASKAEEFLDAYGARQNNKWHRLRELVATLKLFSNVSYILQHIIQFLPRYRLLPTGRDFNRSTMGALGITCSILASAASQLLEEAATLSVPVSKSVPDRDEFAEDLPPGHLPADRRSDKAASAAKTVVYLATAFLNLAEDSKFLHMEHEQKTGMDVDWIPDPINEKRLRELQEAFHNLQSMYDTHISDSDVESTDEDLQVLRGHITVVYHLLETATSFCHFYERHVAGFSHDYVPPSIHSTLQPAELLDLLVNYSILFSSRHILEARSLCHRMLRRYAVEGRITVPVPRYRGFHVRPSTLIAKIVSHYGSTVRMEIDDAGYNAGMSLDLFRANEKLNAHKKRYLAEAVVQLDLETDQNGFTDLAGAVRRAVQLLFEEGKIVLYERNIKLDDIEQWESETLTQALVRVVTQLLTQGKIDVETNMTATFVGDKRVLADIKLLADHNYGEDDFGNNLPLPGRLAYLRK
jgi:hypothetical protein